MFTVAVSSQALFNNQNGHHVYVTKGPDAFDDYMRRRKMKPLREGVAFELVRKLLALNTPGTTDRVNVILLSSNSMAASARVRHSVMHYGLPIEQAFFTGGDTTGTDRFRLAQAAGVELFLSTNPRAVREALKVGIASAVVQPHSKTAPKSNQIRISIDGDRVAFGSEAELVAIKHGLAAFKAFEKANAKVPLAPGPFMPVLKAINKLQAQFPRDNSPIRVAFATARGLESSERVDTTFNAHRVRVDESYFTEGRPKGPYLAAFGADIHFDDGVHHVESAAQYVGSGHVPYDLTPEPQHETARDAEGAHA